MAYFGEPSRAEFPLTPEFATISNNSFVGLYGEKRTINDVQKYVADGGEYYTCDPKVKSELCWPILSPNSLKRSTMGLAVQTTLLVSSTQNVLVQIALTRTNKPYLKLFARC
ncbi:hypothetical protein [Psychrosphaera algicola]|uniref:Uncharacterized protein n=1 Tax=Psychrosphaera algicola TaxID=3023714 RepID=A0ABT5FI16_9GAMM|nr:hypothetical protein [Psychrosphaera sp. G1-22]MDC2890843.1 hypothetical protein [Psychrosphaera sp. G1-22]